MGESRNRLELMTEKDAISLAVTIDRAILQSRLVDISLLAQTDRRDRVEAVVTVLAKLRPGAYLVGCGPYCCGLFPLTVDAVVLGRPPSPLEALPETIVDYTLNDAVLMVPREASRIHATILRTRDARGATYAIRDENSTAGTFVNGRRVSVIGEVTDATRFVRLETGDVISLGASGVNSYIFIDIA